MSKGSVSDERAAAVHREVHRRAHDSRASRVAAYGVPTCVPWFVVSTRLRAPVWRLSYLLVLHSLLDRVPLGHGAAMFWVRPEMLCFPGMGGRFKHTGAKYSRRVRSLYSFRGRVGDVAQVGLDDHGVLWGSVVQVVDPCTLR